ncbi:MAG: sensor histidine kinase [Gaiellaceae bacterium]
MSRTKLVLGVALVLGLGAISTLVMLQRRAAGSRAAQVSLANVSAQLTQIELMPLAASAIPGTQAQKTLVLSGLFHGQEQKILAAVDRLHRGSPPDQLRQVDKPLHAALAAAQAGLPIWVPAMSGGRHMGPAMTKLLTREATALVVVLQKLDDANRAYGSRARLSEIEALSGSAGVVAILLAAFAFFYRRSEASRRELDAQGVTLRLALSDLETVQSDRTKLLHRTVEIAEHERIRVAVDLHDGPIQGLSAVTLGFELLANQLERGNQERALSLTEELRESLAEETVSLRRLMTELRPPILDARDLGAALNDCALQVLDGSAVRWDVNMPDAEIRLAPEVETVVYRVVREALVNVRKHAPEAHVSVTLELNEKHPRLTIVDDGPGFDEDTPLGYTNGAHYGVIGMRERVESVGGTWSLTTAPESGTRIEATLPQKLRAAGVAA